MIVIYTSKVTNRIKYTFDFVFRQYFGIDYTIVNNKNDIDRNKNIYLNYSNEYLANYINVFQHHLLLETTIQPQRLTVTWINDFPIFFETNNLFEIPFDIFSSIFYLLSRYEEYLPHQKDAHGRYVSSNSILAHNAFQFSPIVEVWLQYLKHQLLQYNTSLPFKQHKFTYLPTFDIDNAFRFKGRNWLKNPANIFTASFWRVMMQKKKDDFDSYTDIFSELEKYTLPSIFFFLVNDNGKLNSKVAPTSKTLKQLILNIKNKTQIGIHPSYEAFNLSTFDEEIGLLSTHTHEIATVSRQHFLRISFPIYYHELSNTIIQKDYSLAYPDVPGFRAGTSQPFYFYNLILDTPTMLLIQPSCWMDATFEYYQPIDVEQIILKFLTLINQLKKINGNLVAIFHNDLLATEKYWGVFKFINQQATKKDEL